MYRQQKVEGVAWVANWYIKWMGPLLFYIVQKNVLVCPDPLHLQMGFIHVVDHTHTECDDNSLIFMLSFSVFVVHIKNNS